MEKNLNLFSMRVKEWYAWHFPELTKLVSDNRTYIHCVKLIGDKDKLSEEDLPAIEELVKDSELA